MDFRQPEYVLSKYGIKIKKCCATCIHRHPESEARRICDAGEGLVRPSDVCSNYEIIQKIVNNAGKADGRIRKKDFLMYVLDYPRNHDMRREKSVDDIIEEYESEYGSRFII